MDKKTIIAFVLVGLIIFLWPIFNEKVVGIKNPPKQQPVQQSEKEQAPTSQRPVSEPQSKMEQPRHYTTSKSLSVKVHVPAETLTVETNFYQGKLTNAGGGNIISWKLKKFLTTDKEWIQLIPDTAKGNLNVVFDPSMDISTTLFKMTLDSQWVENKINRQMIRYAQEFEGYGRLEKEMIFSDNSYDVQLHVRFSFTNQTAVRNVYLLQWMSGLSPTENNIREEASYSEATALQGTELLKTKSDNTGLREGITHWAAVQTKYFLMALIPQGFKARGAELKTDKVQINIPSGLASWKRFGVGISAPLETVKICDHEYLVYIGPLDYQILKEHNVQLEKVLNFGWSFIRPFAIAFMYSLQYLYKIVKNYGWAIVIFSILIKILLYPLTKKSYDSMRQMQELQPKLKVLQEKYKAEPKKLNAETMKLYKTHGVNPMGGCLPMLLQMPILFALFNLFRTTIMFRQAGFLGLIKDLSRPDRIIPLGGSATFNVLPLLMGITMFIQQKKTVTDPKQKFMSYFMSIFMIYIFYNLSAGLNLYYFMFNILTIAQDMIIKKHPVQEPQKT
jgi:YidC/Oxa1 family membrane protein insertase